MARTTPALHPGHIVFIPHAKTFLHLLNEHNTLILHHPRHRQNCSLSSSHSLSSPQHCSRYLVTRVSTAPVEYVPPAPDFNFHEEIARLRSLRSRLSDAETLQKKHRVIDTDSKVNRFFNLRRVSIARVPQLANLGSYDVFLIKCLVAAGQEHVISSGLDLVDREINSVQSPLKTALYALVDMIERWDGGSDTGEQLPKTVGGNLKDEEAWALEKLLKTLREIDEFYDCIGGIIGYQISVLELLARSTSGETINRSRHINESLKCQFLEIHSPNGFDLSQNTEYASQAALWGIEGLPDLGEIYPLGGAGDRLNLVDSDTGEFLPAAMLPYCGRTLLEGLIRDLQAREFLYFKLFGKQCITPVAIMTSAAKNNHERISSLCEKNEWFGRGRSNFRLFEQPLVPAVSSEVGKWVVAEPFTPVCKPGGHGVIWKLAYDKGIFRWFYNQRRKGATVRQVSNVVAATDLTLLALSGIGLRHRKKLGFASCKRDFRATEGVNVLIEKKEFDGKWAYGLSCIEYTEFNKYGITDGPPNRLQGEFPANTNILYVDLHSAEEVGSSNDQTSLPGMVLNIKKPIVYTDHFGTTHSVSGGRLECTMQNIADSFCNAYSSRLCEGIENTLDTFIVHNERRRVTSSAKRKRRHGDKSLQQTPDGALLDITRNAYDLLSYCDIEMPKIGSNDEYIESGPPFLIFLHPALGPLWEVTRQKFYGGSISKGSELQIEVAEFFWRDVQLDGSMVILAENVMGSVRINDHGEPILQYGRRCARCKLQNVRVLNKGIDWESGENIYWKHEVQRREVMKVILHGNAEFEAIDVTLQGSHVFEVPDGYMLKITSASSGLSVQLDPIGDSRMDSGSWYWNYKIDGAHIILELLEF
ncbi:hypothetical protein Nepgr_006028 [Nepenthes gracilis]|uniref:UGP3-like C-terminal hexapeptide repeats domain-containing protein n=1 Tax=Nepenthes gracilis TaxID=150966 RepID=A0AAD3S4A2_NEPGR|nr:hypothetical protein Nepgr_006028 [Nepenthes gracilis]